MASQDWFDKDFYKVLGVDKAITDADLKKAYRKLARQHHPDSNAGDAAAEARFKEISEAYSVLSDAEQRREYDQIRALGAGGARFTSPGAGGQGGGNFEDLLGDLFQSRGGGGGAGFRSAGNADFEDILGGMFGGGAGGFGGAGFRQGPARGRDYTATTTLDFRTAVVGDTVRLQGPQGTPITVKIPAGVADGQKIKLRGKGEPSPNGGESGDLVLTVTVRKDAVFTREGLNLRVAVPVTFAEAALGATIEVPTLDGDRVKVKVAAGTPSGRILRVKGRGVKTAKGTGDLLVELQVAVPSHLDGAAREKLEAFVASLPDENPRDDLMAKAGARS
jgi:molecular chaperone DnaJ